MQETTPIKKHSRATLQRRKKLKLTKQHCLSGKSFDLLLSEESEMGDTLVLDHDVEFFFNVYIIDLTESECNTRHIDP